MQVVNEALETYSEKDVSTGPNKENINTFDIIGNGSTSETTSGQMAKSCSSKDAETNTEQVLFKSKTTQTQATTKSVKTQTHIILSTPIILVQDSTLSISSNVSDELDMPTATKSCESHKVATDHDQPTCPSKMYSENEVVETASDSEQSKADSDFVGISDSEYASDDNDDELSASSKEFKKSVLLSSTKPPEKQLKNFVFEEALANAFGVCFQCGAACSVFCEGFIGTNCKIRVSCARNNSHQFSWSTGPLHNHMPILHLLLSSSILCGGLQPSKVFRLFESLNVPCINRREFCNLQNVYVIPAVFNVWKQNQEEVLKDIVGKKFTVASDMRVDSPGHSGLLGAGSTLDVERNVVLDTQIVQVHATWSVNFILSEL